MANGQFAIGNLQMCKYDQPFLQPVILHALFLNLNMEKYRLDKTVSKMQTFAEAERSKVFAKDVSPEDRLRMAFHLTCTIYGIKEGDSLKVDRSVFSARKF